MDSDINSENEIDEAVRNYFKSKNWDGLVTGWVLVASSTNNDGEQDTTSFAIIHPNGTQPWHTALGIIEAGRLKLQDQFLNGDL